jgi:hypothetical protein
MKTPRKGRWIVPLFKRIARTFFLGDSTLFVITPLLVSCGAADGATGGNESSSPGNHGIRGHKPSLVVSSPKKTYNDER